MAKQALTLRVALDDDGTPRIGVMATDDRGFVQIAREGPLLAPHSAAQVGKVLVLLSSAWLEPTLFSTTSEALHDLFESVTSSSRSC